MVWQFLVGSDWTYTPEALLELPASQQTDIQYYGSFSDNLWVLDNGNAKFMNHSTTPNLTTAFGISPMFATRDIDVGEELTCDYDQFHVTPVA